MLITLFPVNIMATENENQNIVKMSTDITAPTGVSVVSFVENGQTVKNGDDIHFIITAQDTESDISAEKSMVYVNGGSVNGTSIKAVEGHANTYEITFGGQFFVEDGLNEIDYIEIVDTAGNATSLDLVDENGNALYTFYGVFQEIDAKVTELTIDTTEIAFDDDTTSVEVNVTAKTDISFSESQSARLYVFFTSVEDSFYTFWIRLDYDVETGYFKGTEIFKSGEEIGTYEFEKIELSCSVDSQWQEQFPNGVPVPAEKVGEKFIGWTYRLVDSETDGEWKNVTETDVIDLRKEHGYNNSVGYMKPTIYVKSVYEKSEDTIPETEKIPDTGTKPDTGNTSETKPVVELEKDTIEKTVENILVSQEGAQITIDMSKSDGTVATVVPTEILEAARENNVNILLDMGNYSWFINSSDILDGTLTDINLEVIMDTNAIPSATVDALANGDKTRQLSLTHNGDFGFKASLTIEVGSEYEGKFGNLYYHDSTGKLVFMNAGKIQKDGTVTVNFLYASDYVIIIGEDRTENQSDINATVPSTNPSAESPKTGDVQNVICILFIVIAVILGKRIIEIK